MGLKNCTITSVSKVETQGDSGAAGTLTTEKILYITPQSGYTVSAGDCSHGTLPAGIDSVSFSNSIAPYARDNTVACVVTLSSAYTMPSANTVLDPNISCTAYAGVREEVGYVFTIREDRSLKITSTVTAAGVNKSGTANTVVETVDGGVNVHTFAGDVPIDVIQTSTSYADMTKVGEYAITYDEGYHAAKLPYLSAYDRKAGVQHDQRVFFKRKSQTINATTGLMTGAVFNIFYKSTKEVTSNSKIQTVLNAPTQIDYSTEKVLYTIGWKDKKITDNNPAFPGESLRLRIGPNYINPDGETKTLVITGSPGAKFNLRGRTMPLTNPDPAFTETILFEELIDESIPSPQGFNNSFGSKGTFEKEVVFPPNDTENRIWFISLQAGTDTVLSESLAGEMISNTHTTYELILKQNSDPKVSWCNSHTSTYSTEGATCVDIKGKPGVYSDEILRRDKNFNYKVYLDWTLTGGGTFTVLKPAPVLSDFTNTDSTLNGGTEVRVKGLEVTGGGSSTVKIKGYVIVDKFGDEDVAVNLNLDNIVSYS